MQHDERREASRGHRSGEQARKDAFPRRAAAGTAIAVLALALASAAAAETVSEPVGDSEYGAYLAGECATCHQESGEYDGIPPIVGWPKDVFVAVMRDYREGERENPVMRTIAGRYDDEALRALAAYFASLGSGAKNNTR